MQIYHPAVVGQRHGRCVGLLGAWLLATALASCQRPSAPAHPPAGVASLSPAATELLVAMGLADQLVAMSNWDAARPPVAGLPRVGDYRNVDWERLAILRPAVLVVQIDPQKIPPGLQERARQQDMRLINVRINRLEDIFATFAQLGAELGAPDRAAVVSGAVRAELAEVRRRAAAEPAVPTYLARDATGLASVGGDNFMNDLLTIAGGTNVITGGQNSYPTVDRERLHALNPQAILHLLPSAPPQVLEEARRQWQTMPELAAVRAGRVYLLDDYYLLQPGARVADTARQLAKSLHPQLFPATQPSVQGTP